MRWNHWVVLGCLALAAPALAQDDKTTMGGQRVGIGQPTAPETEPGKTTQMGQPARKEMPEGPAHDSTTGALATDDRTILNKLHDINHHEISAGNLAKQKGNSSRVRRYGEQLVKDHEASEKKVMGLARKLTVPIGQTDLGDSVHKAELQKHENQMSELNGLSGPDFDRAFLTNMIQGHEKAIEMITITLLTVQNPQTQKALQETLSMLGDHHKLALELAATPAQGRRGEKR